MDDIIEWLSIVNWPGAAIVIAAIWFGAWVAVKCYGREKWSRR